MRVKLISSDRKIILVGLEVIKHIVAIQTMLEDSGVDNNTGEGEPIRIFEVKSKVLEKVVRQRMYLKAQRDYWRVF